MNGVFLDVIHHAYKLRLDPVIFKSVLGKNGVLIVTSPVGYKVRGTVDMYPTSNLMMTAYVYIVWVTYEKFNACSCLKYDPKNIRYQFLG
jgi:hypothetical protein